MECICLKCGFEWNSRVVNPRACAKCKSYAWREPRKNHEKDYPNKIERPEETVAQADVRRQREREEYESRQAHLDETGEFPNADEEIETDSNFDNEDYQKHLDDIPPKF